MHQECLDLTWLERWRGECWLDRGGRFVIEVSVGVALGPGAHHALVANIHTSLLKTARGRGSDLRRGPTDDADVVV